MKQDAFKPYAGQQVSMVGAAPPNLGGGQNRPGPVMGVARAPSPAQFQAPLPMDPASRGAAISSKREVPRGANEVRLAPVAPPVLGGTKVDQGERFQPADAVSLAPQGSPQMGQAPRPFLQRGQPAPAGEKVFRVTMRGRAPDGGEYASVYDAAFPAGTEPLGEPEFTPLT